MAPEALVSQAPGNGGSVQGRVRDSPGVVARREGSGALWAGPGVRTRSPLEQSVLCGWSTSWAEPTAWVWPLMGGAHHGRSVLCRWRSLVGGALVWVEPVVGGAAPRAYTTNSSRGWPSQSRSRERQFVDLCLPWTRGLGSSATPRWRLRGAGLGRGRTSSRLRLCCSGGRVVASGICRERVCTVAPSCPSRRFCHKAPPSYPRRPLQLRPLPHLTLSPLRPWPQAAARTALAGDTRDLALSYAGHSTVPSPRGSLDLTHGPPGCVPMATLLS